jgi:hypothetical protein
VDLTTWGLPEHYPAYLLLICLGYLLVFCVERVVFEVCMMEELMTCALLLLSFEWRFQASPYAAFILSLSHTVCILTQTPCRDTTTATVMVNPTPTRHALVSQPHNARHPFSSWTAGRAALRVMRQTIRTACLQASCRRPTAGKPCDCAGEIKIMLFCQTWCMHTHTQHDAVMT